MPSNKQKLKSLFEQYPKSRILLACFYPVTTLFTTPVRLLQTLWACRVLIKEKWKDYNRFAPHTGINSLFYWALAVNFKKYGKSGYSPSLGLGDYPLSRMFCYSLTSLYLYLGASNFTTVMGIFGWGASHIIWAHEVEGSWVLSIMGLTLISTTFYSNAFSKQNYNALGWIFFPIGMYGIYTGNWTLASTAWFLASFLSFAVVIMGSILCLTESIVLESWMPLLSILPAVAKLGTHLIPNFSQGLVKNGVFDQIKAVGFLGKSTKYNRPYSWKMTPQAWYYVLIYCQFGLGCYWLGIDSYFIWAGLLVYCLNQSYLRFTDEQHIHMLLFSMAIAITIQNPDWRLLPHFWLVASPIPLLAGFTLTKVLDVVPKLRPFHVKPFVEGMMRFLNPVNKGQRVLMAFENPVGNYNNICDGYRVHTELLLYAASLKEINYMPEFLAVFEVNYEGAPEFWGREVKEVMQNINQWKVDFVIIYQENDTQLDPKWVESGFDPVGEFDWVDFSPMLEESYMMKPKWWLLKPPPQ